MLPEVDYAAVTFTIPKILRPYFLWDRSLYGDLCRAAYAAARLYLAAHFPALRRCAPAAVVSPQSWGSLLNFHPHAHGLLSLGVFSPEGAFHPLEGPLDTAVVRDLFEAEVFRFLLRKDLISEERVALVRSWRHSGFHLSAERTIAAGERRELEGVLQYMERPPVSLRRLEYQGDGRVLYRGKYHPGLKTDHRLVSAVDFLALLVPHIALRYECRIHSYGAISSTWRRRGVLRGAGDAGGESDAARGQAAPGAQGEGGEEQVVGEAEQAEQRAAGRREVVALEADEQSAFVRLRRRSWGRLIAKVWLDDPSLCRCCGKPMKILAAFSSPRDDAVIEKILRCRGEFDPPWRRERRARGPPDRSGAGGCDVLDALEYAQLGPEVAEEDCSQLAPEDAEDQYSQLPPSEDDRS